MKICAPGPAMRASSSAISSGSSGSESTSSCVSVVVNPLSRRSAADWSCTNTVCSTVASARRSVAWLRPWRTVTGSVIARKASAVAVT